MDLYDWDAIETPSQNPVRESARAEKQERRRLGNRGHIGFANQIAAKPAW
jgi:hypothetical protein